MEEHDPNLFTRTDSTFIDLYMKSGMYITEIVKKLFHNTRENYASDEDCLKHILENQVYGLSPTSILQGITQSYIFGFDVDKKIARKNFVQHDLVPEAQAGVAKEKLKELFKHKEYMKFDAVVGNPPYQEADGLGGQGSSAKPIYHLFLNSAKKLKPINISMIMPTRWYAGGKGLDAFRKQMLDDSHIVKLHDFHDPSLIFPNTNIRGGVCFIIWNEHHNNKLLPTKIYSYTNNLNPIITERNLKTSDIDVFIRYTIAIDILEKVIKDCNFRSFEKHI